MYSPCDRVSTTNRFAKPQEEYHITITYIYKNIDGVKRIIMKKYFEKKFGEGTAFDLDYGKLLILALLIYIAFFK